MTGIDPLDELVDKPYAMKYLGCSRATLDRMIRDREIEVVHVGRNRGTVRFTVRELHAYRERNTTPREDIERSG